MRIRCDVAREIAGAVLAVPADSILRPNRSFAPVCHARHVAMYLANVSLRVSLTAMAAEFGRDRTSCAHAVRRIEDRRDEPGFDAFLSRLEGLASLLDAALPDPRGPAPRDDAGAGTGR